MTRIIRVVSPDQPLPARPARTYRPPVGPPPSPRPPRFSHNEAIHPPQRASAVKEHHGDWGEWGDDEDGDLE